MILNVLSRFVNRFSSSTVRHGNLFLNQRKLRYFSTTVALRRKKSKKGKGGGKDSLQVIKPEYCDEFAKPTLTALCKAAIVIGGASGFGFSAADYLLSKGARGVIIADDNPAQGNAAVRKLCESYGLGRATFLTCDIRNSCKFEGALCEAVNQHKEIHVLFNDLDKDRPPVDSSHCGEKENNSNNTRKIIDAGMKIMSKENGGVGGIIVNCASILGFMGWPDDPTPVYCMKDPAIETTQDLAKEYNTENTGVRLVALCPTNKEFGAIGLPDFPDASLKNKADRKPCIPASTWRIGFALEHVMAWARNGSVWVVEAPACIREVPRLIHFPQKEGDKVDLKVYEVQTCPPAIEAHCAVLPKEKCSKNGSKKSKRASTKKK